MREPLGRVSIAHERCVLSVDYEPREGTPDYDEFSFAMLVDTAEDLNKRKVHTGYPGIHDTVIARLSY